MTRKCGFSAREVNWQTKKNSDLDLVIFDASSTQVENLRDAFIDSSLPFTVDLLSWQNISRAYQQNIKKNHSVIQGKKPHSKMYFETNFKYTDIGKVPEDWEVREIGEKIIFNPKEELIERNEKRKYVEMKDLVPFQKYIKNFVFKEFKGGSKFRNRDVLMARITPCLENGKISYVNILNENEVGFGSTEFTVLREKKKETESKYIYYLAILNDFKNLAIKSMMGSSGRQRVQNSILEKKLFCFPSLAEQKRISKILSAFDEKIAINNEINKS